jgi:hypothetical protein
MVQVGIDGKALVPAPVAVHVLIPVEPEVARYPEEHEMEQPVWPVVLELQPDE